MPKLEFDVPDETWAKFEAAAALQFPKSATPASAFLSEVINAGVAGETITYFMTGVPRDNASALQQLLAQNRLTWDEFHAMLLMSAVKPGMLRLMRFHGNGEDGVFIATGLSKRAFDAIEAASGKSVEVALATLFSAAQSELLTFPADTAWIEPVGD